MKLLRITKVVLFISALVPFARLLWKFFGPDPRNMQTWGAGLGANPIEVITHSTGDWTLILLLVTLSISPLRKLTKQYWLIGLRRMVGLFAFFYASLHFTTYIWLDKFFDWHEMVKDIAKRPFITVGFAAFVLLVPLAMTSTAASIRRLGGKNWQRLHRAIYATAMLGVLHYIWLVKADLRKPLQYAAVLTLLLGYRLVMWFLDTRKPAPARDLRQPTPQTNRA